MLEKRRCCTNSAAPRAAAGSPELQGSWCSSSLLWSILCRADGKLGLYHVQSPVIQAKGGHVPSCPKWRLLLLYCPSHPSKDTPDTGRESSAPMVLLITLLIANWPLLTIQTRWETETRWWSTPLIFMLLNKNHFPVDPSLGPCLMFHTVQENCSPASTVTLCLQLSYGRVNFAFSRSCSSFLHLAVFIALCFLMAPWILYHFLLFCEEKKLIIYIFNYLDFFSWLFISWRKTMMYLWIFSPTFVN